MARSPAARVSLSLLLCLAAACLSTVQAAPAYEGVGSFINSFLNFTETKLPGASLRSATAAEVLGLSLSGMSAIHITLDPCTVLQPHIHPHPEFNFVLKGAVTHSVVFNNGSLAGLAENTMMGVQSPGWAIFPAGQLHLTQNEGCTAAEVLAVFPVPAADAYFFPASEGFMPNNTVASFFGGKASNDDLKAPVGTAKLAGCSCPGSRRMLR